MSRTLLVTGGAGFIGSHVVRLLVNKYPDYRIINLDKLTYAGNLANLRDIEDRPNYRFVKADICDFDTILALLREEAVDGIIHLAAESHVDRSTKNGKTVAKLINPTVSAVDSISGILEGVDPGDTDRHSLRKERLSRYEIDD